MTHRFFVEPEAIAGDQASLGGAQARQIATVLRLAPGDEITLLADGVEHAAVIERADPRAVVARVRERRPASGEPRANVTMALPLLRGDRSEEVIEAVTQLGVSRVAPFTSARSVVRTLPEAKRQRWERIAREAAETARRGRVPAIDAVRDWSGLLDALRPPVLVAWERETSVRLAQAVPAGASTLAIVIGPEGGLAEQEVVEARGRGFATVSLGVRNLRSETAAIAAVALAMERLD